MLIVDICILEKHKACMRYDQNFTSHFFQSETISAVTQPEHSTHCTPEAGKTLTLHPKLSTQPVAFSNQGRFLIATGWQKPALPFTRKQTYQKWHSIWVTAAKQEVPITQATLHFLETQSLFLGDQTCPGSNAGTRCSTQQVDWQLAVDF